MKILVTGGNGEFCKHLVGAGKKHSFLTPDKQSMYPGLDVRDYWNVDYYFRKRENDFDIRCSVTGGGLSGQVGAIIHGISRALVEFEPALKPTLKKEKLTTRDSRSVERKKYGHRKARRSYQFSKR